MNNIIEIDLDNLNSNENQSLLKVINKLNSEVKVRFNFNYEEIIDMFYFYVKINNEHVQDIEFYSCINPEIILKENDNLYFDLGFIDDEEDSSDIKFLIAEFKQMFGISLKRQVRLKQLLQIMFMNCKELTLQNNFVSVSYYYENYDNSWLKKYINKEDIN